MPSCLIHLPAITFATPVNLVGTPVANLVTTPTLPAHVAGQMIAVWLYRRSSAVAITKPAATASVPEWFDIDNNAGANGTNSRSAWALASGNAHTLGSWGNAEMFVAAVFENQAASPIGGHAESGGVGTSVVIPALTVSNTDGTSALLYLGGSTTNPTWAAAPAGFTRRAEYDSPVNVGGVFLNTKDDTTTDGSSSQGTTPSIGYRGQSIEIRSHSAFEPFRVAITTPGDYTWEVPSPAPPKIDRIAIGGGTSGANSTIAAANGGRCAVFAWDTLTLGVDYSAGDIITGTVGLAGTGNVNAGTASTATCNGNTLTGAAGPASLRSGQAGETVNTGNANSNKDVSLNGQLYEGGTGAAGGSGTSPGNGGSGGGGGGQGGFAGAPGRVWFYAHS